MAKRTTTRRRGREDAFRHKLVLNAFLIREFGIDPLRDHTDTDGRAVPPIRRLSAPIRTTPEGLDDDGLHRFYHAFKANLPQAAHVTTADLLRYEENIVRHTAALNAGRARAIEWKYFQWLTLLFVERYLDLYVHHPTDLLDRLNEFVGAFNRWRDDKGLTAEIAPFEAGELNKVCLQNATGSGKTLLMHVNLAQFRHYAREAGTLGQYSRAILLTPGEDLTAQHLRELRASGIPAERFRPDLLSQPGPDLARVDALEVHKLGEEDKEKTVATRNFGDANLLLVDEGHVGLGNRESETGFLARRNALSARGFVFEYSATFAQAVESANDEAVTQAYAKSVLFDYSYRYFYEDGFGKDYQIFNFADREGFASRRYLTAGLLSFYQQLRLFEERRHELRPFNLEKPLWVFVGAYVSKAGGANQDEKASLSDVAQILRFLGVFLADPDQSRADIEALLSSDPAQSGLLDEDGHPIFEGSFTYLREKLDGGETIQVLHGDVLRRLFQSPGGGTLTLRRIRGSEAELTLRAGASETPFGLINVGDAPGLASYLAERAELKDLVRVEESAFDGAPLFAKLSESASPVNLLIGSRRFVAGWDSWRVSTLGLMRVGRSEGSQIIQLFGRGVRLKGYDWSLKRSRYTDAPVHPRHIELLETLGVFGVRSDYMQDFRSYLATEGLPGNERTTTFEVPMNLVYDFGTKLKVLRPKKKRADGREYDFRRDGARLVLGPPPAHFRAVTVDWYPRIQSVVSHGSDAEVQKNTAKLQPAHLAFVDWGAVGRVLETFRLVRGFHTLGIDPERLPALFESGKDGWYTLTIPEHELEMSGWSNVAVWEQVVTELLKRYAEAFASYHQRAFIEPRLELRELGPDDENLPQDGETHQLIVDATATTLIQDIERLKQEIEKDQKGLIQSGPLKAYHLGHHLYTPLLHGQGGRIRIAPVALNKSEFDFVAALERFLDQPDGLDLSGAEVYLLRNRSRGSGIGFFEAGGFYPDFILWVVKEGVQHIGFVEPHGLVHEGPADRKVLFHRTIKDIEARLNDPGVTLDSFILSPTPYAQLSGKWGWGSLDAFAERHVLFLADPAHVKRLLSALLEPVAAGPPAEAQT